MSNEEKLKEVYVSPNGNDTNPGTPNKPKKTITNALSNIQDHGTIYLKNGIYSESGINIINHVKIVGENMDKTVISGQETGRPIFIVYEFKVDFKNFNITNGYEDSGGAINNYGTLTLDHIKIDENEATTVGGAICNDGLMIIKNCILQNNHSMFNGGAIYNLDTMEIYNSIFINNASEEDGGAIYNLNLMKIESCKFIKNESRTNGGAICHSENNLSINNCTFQDNVDLNNDTGIYNETNETILIENTTFE